MESASLIPQFRFRYSDIKRAVSLAPLRTGLSAMALQMPGHHDLSFECFLAAELAG